MYRLFLRFLGGLFIGYLRFLTIASIMGIVLHAIMNIIHLRSFVGIVIHITWDSAV